MRNVLAAALAAPVIALIVARSIGQRAGARGLSAIAVVLAIGAIGVFSSPRPTPATAIPPTRTTTLDARELTTEIRTSESPTAPVTVTFSSPMSAPSVERLVQITPSTDVDLSWDATGTLLSIAPRSAWKPGTYYTVTVAPGALDASGRPLERPIRAAFLTRPPVTATVAATSPTSPEAGIATAFRIAFSGPVDESSLDVLVRPAVEGSLAPVAGSRDAAPTFDFIPDDPLQPDTDYTVTLGPGSRDRDGAEIVASALTIRTAAAPAVVRFRPRNGWADVAQSQVLSVRFAEPMDRASTEAAWSAVQGATVLEGAFSWAENDTVLVFDPKGTLDYGQKITMTVGTDAVSKAGLPLQAPASATFTTIAKPKPPSTAGPTTGSGSTGGGSAGGDAIGGSGTGGSVGAGTWTAVEAYYLDLMNCTRTGGTVTSSGTCSSPGGREVAPLFQDAGISAKVSRPYAKVLAVNGLCTHFSGGTPADRLRAAGYTSYIWAQNLGCRSGDPFKAVLATHLFYQSEAPTNGGHWVNLMNPKYDRVGLGVWVSGGRVRLVVDFYRPL